MSDTCQIVMDVLFGVVTGFLTVYAFVVFKMGEYLSNWTVFTQETPHIACAH